MSNLTSSSSRKHDARHRKDHRCGEDGCEARFGTRNDLERHRKSVHSKCPQCGPKETYKCFGRNCGHPEKVWPRLDNFKAHLRHKHSEEDEEQLLSQYMTQPLIGKYKSTDSVIGRGLGMRNGRRKKKRRSCPTRM